MIASRRANDALFELRRREVRHFVVSTAQLETVHRLLVLTLEQNRVVKALAQILGRL